MSINYMVTYFENANFYLNWTSALNVVTLLKKILKNNFFCFLVYFVLPAIKPILYMNKSSVLFQTCTKFQLTVVQHHSLKTK